MISQLMRTQIESNFRDLALSLSIFVGLLIFLGLLAAEPASEDSNDMEAIISIFVFATLFASLYMAIKVSVRHVREKRTRLFAQLPVSNSEVTLASWIFRLVSIGVPTVAWMLLLTLNEERTIIQLALDTAAFFLSVTLLVAAICVAINLSNLSSSVSRYWKWLAITADLLVVLVLFFWVQIEVWDRVLEVGQGSDGLQMVTFLAFSAAALVLMDVWLQKRADGHLG